MSSSTPPTPQTPPAALRLRRATPADTAAIVRVVFDAFGPGVISRLLHPGGGSASARARFGQRLFDDGHHGSGARSHEEGVERIVMVAEHGELMVAVAKWTLVRAPAPAPWDVAHEAATQEQLGEGANVEVFNVLNGGVHGMRRKWMRGDPVLHLDMIACTTTRQRLGAASALLRWGVELADREGLPTWLESSSAGYSLYRKFGFEDVDVHHLNITELWGVANDNGENWGAGHAVALAGEAPPGVYRTVMMRRQPRRLQEA